MTLESSIIEPIKLKHTLLGFFIAPIIPVFLYSLSAGAYFLVIFLVAVPAAYVGALIIGVPLFYIFRKLNCLSWHYFVLGGVLSVLPFALIYSGSANTHLEISGLSNMVVFFSLGAIGGLIFWLISIRGKYDAPKSKVSNFIGLSAIALISLGCIYIYYLGSTKSLEGKMLQQNIGFISSSSREVKIKLNNESQVEAYLPEGLPFRPNCPIYVTTRRSYINRNQIYWVNGYKDSAYVNVWSILEQSQKDDIPKTCE